MFPFRPARRSSTAGFTLLESLIVVFMVAILAAIAAPGWLAYVNRQRVRTVQNDLAEVLRQTQTNAQQTRQAQTVTIEDGEEVPTININGATQVLGSDNIPAGSVTLTPNNNSISFDYQGAPSTADVPFLVTVTTRGNLQRCVMVTSLLGTVKTTRDGACNDLSNGALSSNTD